MKLEKPTMNLRWYYPQGVNGPKILQQKWENEWGGQSHWRDIPIDVCEVQIKRPESK